MSTQSRWVSDPTGRHELRFWDGFRFTDHVSDSGHQSTDPFASNAPTGSPQGQPVQPAQQTYQGQPSPTAAPVWQARPTPSGSPSLSDPVFRVLMYGADQRMYSFMDLQGMARARVLSSETMVQHRDSPYPVPASQIPGVFSDKTYMTALLLSFFLGGLGIDRFYLGYSGIGVAKLLTLGGCGLWALVDFILIAMRSVPDSDGRPLA